VNYLVQTNFVFFADVKISSSAESISKQGKLEDKSSAPLNQTPESVNVLDSTFTLRFVRFGSKCG